MDTGKQPGIQISSIVLEGFNFNRAERLDVSIPHPVRVEAKRVVSLDSSKRGGKVSLFVLVKEQKESLFEIAAQYSLYASVVEGQENIDLANYLEGSGAATLYQFSRETILTVSQKAGIAVIIPPMNLSSPPPLPPAEKE